ncbi:MAG: hypothetical protein H0Z25_04115 [Kosmotoga sp.]|nr:hypothetical protein [Kosmotoga sp.]MBO8166384.1 hypothetical protein [Kosmotoga sp.]
MKLRKVELFIILAFIGFFVFFAFFLYPELRELNDNLRILLELERMGR